MLKPQASIYSLEASMLQVTYLHLIKDQQCNGSGRPLIGARDQQGVRTSQVGFQPLFLYIASSSPFTLLLLYLQILSIYWFSSPWSLGQLGPSHKQARSAYFTLTPLLLYYLLLHRSCLTTYSQADQSVFRVRRLRGCQGRGVYIRS